MALRRRLARRLSGLKQIGVELPVVEALAVLPAEVRQRLYLPKRPAVPFPELRVGIPAIVHGRAYGWC